MDTRQRPKSEAARRQGRSAEQNRKKSNGTGTQRRRSTAQRSSSTARRPEQAQRRAEQPQRRTAQTAARSRQAAAQQTVRHARQIQSDAPEMVFKPDQKQQVRTRDPQAARRKAMRRRSAQRTEERKKEAERAKNRPTVTYTQPKPLNVNRLLLQLAVVIAVVLAIVLGLSVFFKVETVVVYGNNAYSAWTIQEAAGIEGGENLLTFGNTRACGKIMAALPYVDNVRIGIKLPDTVNIYIEEIDVAYAIQSQDGTWWLMTSGGKVVEQIDSGIAVSYTKVLGVELDSPQVGEPGKAVEEIIPVTETTDGAEATVATEAIVAVTGAGRLAAALQILTALEQNDIVGEAASVDVTSLVNIELWYGQQYQVKLGDTNRMDYKIASMKAAINQLNDYDMGILDVSFTTVPDQPSYKAFD